MKNLVEAYHGLYEIYFKTYFDEDAVRPYPDNPSIFNFPHTYLKSDPRSSRTA
jgi:hypothetical protein